MAIQISTWLAIYFVLWWVMLFVTLPFGVRSQHEEGGDLQGTDPGAPVATGMLWQHEDGVGAPGTDPGAPILTRMGHKLIWTTIISAIVFGIGLAAYHAGYLSIERLSKLMGMPF